MEEDLGGSELETLVDAVEEAKQAAREMMAEKVAKGEVVDGAQSKSWTKTTLRSLYCR
jgi:hypothetical protein